MFDPFVGTFDTPCVCYSPVFVTFDGRRLVFDTFNRLGFSLFHEKSITEDQKFVKSVIEARKGLFMGFCQQIQELLDISRILSPVSGHEIERTRQRQETDVKMKRRESCNNDRITCTSLCNRLPVSCSQR